jgi:ADP-heptose:LPS heptosyltransferase
MPQKSDLKKPAHILAVRFSAFGNVVMLRPVLKFFCNARPDIKITLLTREIYKPVFSDIKGLNFIGINTNNYGGFEGLKRLSGELRKEGFTHYLDLHSVFRTYLLGFFIGLPVFRIRKDRWQKYSMTRRCLKSRKPITHTSLVYSDVFKATGLYPDSTLEIPQSPKTIIKKGPLKIGIAPMSKNHLKEWPLSRMNELAEKLKKTFHARIFIFGAKEERQVIEENFPNIKDIVAGSMDMEAEINLIKDLGFMISMDSGNMHLASVFGVPVVSIWGPTHPDAAFGPRGSLSLLIQNEDLPCRPCSIYGQIPCYRKDHACMNDLSVGYVFDQIQKFIYRFFA